MRRRCWSSLANVPFVHGASLVTCAAGGRPWHKPANRRHRHPLRLGFQPADGPPGTGPVRACRFEIVISADQPLPIVIACAAAIALARPNLFVCTASYPKACNFLSRVSAPSIVSPACSSTRHSRGTTTASRSKEAVPGLVGEQDHAAQPIGHAGQCQGAAGRKIREQGWYPYFSSRWLVAHSCLLQSGKGKVSPDGEEMEKMSRSEVLSMLMFGKPAFHRRSLLTRCLHKLYCQY